MKNTQATYPEIDSMNSLRDINEALNLGWLNRNNVKPECLQDLDNRLAALYRRALQLQAARGAK